MDYSEWDAMVVRSTLLIWTIFQIRVYVTPTFMSVQPANGQLGYYNYVGKPEDGPKSQLRVQLVLLFTE